VIRGYSNDNERFTCCSIDYRKQFGGDCRPGFVRDTAVVRKNSGGGTCQIVSYDAGYRVTVRFHNNGLEGADCNVIINERRTCD
jgi:hypothetical protein